MKLTGTNIDFPVTFRARTSDLEVFREVIVDQVYAFDIGEPVQWIVDCGANVGFTSAFFLSRYQKANLIAIEPDPSNYALLCANVESFGQRAIALQAGLWDHATSLKISDRSYRDNRHWSTQVRECEPDAPNSFQAVSIADLLDRWSIPRISILKVDIEGAEAVVFESAKTWIDRIDCIAIELHDDSVFGSGTKAFENAIADRRFQTRHHSGITICTRLDRN